MLQVDIYTASGAPAVSTPVLRSLAGKPGAAKKALLELEGQDTSDSPADDFDGEFSKPVIGCSRGHDIFKVLGALPCLCTLATREEVQGVLCCPAAPH